MFVDARTAVPICITRTLYVKRYLCSLSLDLDYTHSKGTCSLAVETRDAIMRSNLHRTGHGRFSKEWLLYYVSLAKFLRKYNFSDWQIFVFCGWLIRPRPHWCVFFWLRFRNAPFLSKTYPSTGYRFRSVFPVHTISFWFENASLENATIVICACDK